jgi:hypothetical protein
MNNRGRAVRAQLLTCAVLLGLLACTGLRAQENVTLNERAPVARLSAIGDDPDPILWNRYQPQVRLSQRFVLDAMVAITSYAGPGCIAVPRFGSLFLPERTTTTAGERARVPLGGPGRPEPARQARTMRR